MIDFVRTDTDVKKVVAAALRDDRWRVVEEFRVPTMSKFYRSGRIPADVAIVNPSGEPVFLVEAKRPYVQVGDGNQQYIGYVGTFVPFCYIFGHDIDYWVDVVRKMVGFYYPNPMPLELCSVTDATKIDWRSSDNPDWSPWSVDTEWSPDNKLRLWLEGDDTISPFPWEW